MDSVSVDTTCVAHINALARVICDTVNVSVTDTVYVEIGQRATGGSGANWIHAGVLILVTIAGWGAVHLLSIRAQKRHYRDVIRNEARVAIGDAIARYQRWLEKYSAIVGFLWSDNLVRNNKMTELAEHLKDEAAFEWVNRIVEYERLFPGLVQRANSIRARHERIRDSVEIALERTTLRGDGQREGSPKEREATGTAVEQTDAVYTEAFQLRRSLQRDVLGKIFGNSRDWSRTL